MKISITKPELIKIYNIKSGEKVMVNIPNLEKEVNLFLIVVF